MSNLSRGTFYRKLKKMDGQISMSPARIEKSAKNDTLSESNHAFKRII